MTLPRFEPEALPYRPNILTTEHSALGAHMNIQTPCPPLFCDSRFHAPPENSLTLPGTPPSTTPPHLPSPALGSWREAEARPRDSKFYMPSGNRARDLAMEGLIHTTELDRLDKPQALSRTPRLHHSPHLPLPQAEAGPQNFFRNFTRLPQMEPRPHHAGPRTLLKPLP